MKPVISFKKCNCYKKFTVHTLAFVIFAILAVSNSSAPADNNRESPIDSILPQGLTQTELQAYLMPLVPEFTVPAKTAVWDQEAAKLKKRLLNEVVFRGVPQVWRSEKTNVVWGDVIEVKGYKIRKLRYEIIPGFWAGGLLYEPLNIAGKVPVVLSPNGHETGTGMFADYKQARCINLVKRGIITLSMEWVGMGQLKEEGYWHGNIAYLDLCGVSGLSIFYLSLSRGLDILCSHKNADTQKVAVSGLSGGGWQTIVIAALDPRVKLAVPVAGYIGLKSRIRDLTDIGDLEQNYSDFVSIADYVHLTAMLAPRPALLIYNANDDCCFEAYRAKPSVFDPVVPLYQLYGQSSQFLIHINENPGTHNYLKDNREAFYRFINRHFLPETDWIDNEIDVDNEIMAPEELKITYPPDNGTFYTVTAGIMQSLPHQKRPSGGKAAISQWRSKTRQMLKEVVRPEAGLVIDENPTVVQTFSDTVNGIDGKAYLLCDKKNTWTLPMIKYISGNSKAQTTVIIADRGLKDACGVVSEVLNKNGNAIVLDILFTGECVPSDGLDWMFAEVISTLGRRPLGIQSSQLDAVLEYIRKAYPKQRLQVITIGRVAGLAALVQTALEPQYIENLELRGMVPSLKDLLAKKVIYKNESNMFTMHELSLFCSGLLELVDVPELIELAHPVKIRLSPSDFP